MCYVLRLDNETMTDGLH